MSVQILKKTQKINISFDSFLKKQGIKPEIHYTVMKYFARASQFLSWPFAYVYFNLFYNLRISGRENLANVSSPFIIISNHVAFYDSFVFRLVFCGFIKKLPLRFMAVNSFNTWYLNLFSKLFITDIIYIIYGVFVVVRGRGINKNLEEAVRIIKNGGNVVVYPEGSIIHSGRVEKFKLGAASLAKKTGATVVPISMKMEGKKFRKDYTINVGKPINIDTNMSVEQINYILYNKVNTLHG